jgi:hypothetical protein
MRHTIFTVGSLAWALAAASLAEASPVVAFGDSWAAGAWDELDASLAKKGYGFDVYDGGVAGSTAEAWATGNPSALPTLVSLNPDAKWVWLSLGGNDVFQHYVSGNGAATAADNDKHLRTLLDALFAVHPNIHVVMFGYDYVNFEQSTECIQQAFLYFGPTSTATVNGIFDATIHAVQAQLAADYPRVTYVPQVKGTWQKAGGVPGAPNPLFPSPSKYMADCIHGTSQGYSLLMDVLVDYYWGKAAPTASIGAASSACVGEALTLTSTSVGADALVWTVDGAPAGSQPTVTLDTSAPGTQSVTLVAIAGAWSDSSTVDVTVMGPGSLELSGAGGPVSSGAKTAHTLVGAAAGDAVLWKVKGGQVTSAVGVEIEILWGAPGVGEVSAAVTPVDGCKTAGSWTFDIVASTEPDTAISDAGEADVVDEDSTESDAAQDDAASADGQGADAADAAHGDAPGADASGQDAAADAADALAGADTAAVDTGSAEGDGQPGADTPEWDDASPTDSAGGEGGSGVSRDAGCSAVPAAGSSLWLWLLVGISACTRTRAAGRRTRRLLARTR